MIPIMDFPCIFSWIFLYQQLVRKFLCTLTLVYFNFWNVRRFSFDYQIRYASVQGVINHWKLLCAHQWVFLSSLSCCTPSTWIKRLQMISSLGFRRKTWPQYGCLFGHSRYCNHEILSHRSESRSDASHLLRCLMLWIWSVYLCFLTALLSVIWMYYSPKQIWFSHIWQVISLQVSKLAIGTLYP